MHFYTHSIFHSLCISLLIFIFCHFCTAKYLNENNRRNKQNALYDKCFLSRKCLIDKIIKSEDNVSNAKVLSYKVSR